MCRNDFLRVSSTQMAETISKANCIVCIIHTRESRVQLSIIHGKSGAENLPYAVHHPFRESLPTSHPLHKA